MRLVTVHSDFIEFTPVQKAVKAAEEAAAGETTRVTDCLVAFCAAEEGDDELAAAKAADEIDGVAEQVKADRIVLYPWVHLTSRPAKPEKALALLKQAAKLLEEMEYEVVRAPFGWYKSFDLKAKGHPLAELSREIRGEGAPKERVSKALQTEAKAKSEYFILTPEGELVPVASFDFKKFPQLKKLADYEIHKVRAYEKEPPHIRLMREHAIAWFEPGSDSGNLRWYPAGRLVKKLLEKKVSSLCISYGAMEVETPVMYDFEHPTLKKYLDRFPARQYVVESEDKELFLRFAACFGQFLIARDAVISHRSLPLKIYELTKYSFRREQSGEVAGLRRLRAFTMPDMHTLCRDLPQAKEEFAKQFELCQQWLAGLALPFETAFRVQKDFYEENGGWYKRFAKRLGKPIFIEMFAERYAYFITKFEFNFIDNLDKASALSTVQIDVENAETYDISFVNEKGEKQKPVLLHASLSGSTDRNVYALLEEQARKIAMGKTPLFPTWLAPTQLRLVPVSDAQNPACEKLLAELSSKNIRVDFDDRTETLQKKVRDAEKEWIPYIAVVGEKEAEGGFLSVRVRSTGKQEKMKPAELVSCIASECAGQPFEPLSLPTHLSRRAIF
ncbi:MAG: threonine--tRNA ligase [Candidatus Micrarchaeia archaeon]